MLVVQASHISCNPTSPTEEKVIRLGDLSGIISKAKEELIKSKSRHDLRNLENSSSGAKVEVKKSENELHWESLLQTLDRPLQICDLDFTDLRPDDDSDPLSVRSAHLGPPPPPPLNGVPPPPMPGMIPPPLPSSGAPPPPPPSRCIPAPSLFFGVKLNHNSNSTEPELCKKNKKTVKLFWREIREDSMSLNKVSTLWDELRPVEVDKQKLEHLFESRSKDLMSKVGFLKRQFISI